MPLDSKPTPIEEQISNAETLVITRTLDGNATIKMIIDGVEEERFVPSFADAIDGLVICGVEKGAVASVAMQRVSPEIMFDTKPRIDFFRISFHGADGARLGGRDTLKYRDDVAVKLAPKLTAG